MADKKEYTPQEVAEAILKKCQELYDGSTLAKANTAHEVESGSEASNSEAECTEQLTAGECAKEGDSEEKKEKKKEGSEDSDSEESEMEEEAEEAAEEEVEEHEEEHHEESDEDSENEEKKEEKKPFEKAEEMDKCGDMKAIGKADKLKSFMEKRKKKDKKIEKFLGLGGTQTSTQAGGASQGKPAAPAPGTSIADQIGFGKKEEK